MSPQRRPAPNRAPITNIEPYLASIAHIFRATSYTVLNYAVRPEGQRAGYLQLDITAPAAPDAVVIAAWDETHGWYLGAGPDPDTITMTWQASPDLPVIPWASYLIDEVMRLDAAGLTAQNASPLATRRRDGDTEEFEERLAEVVQAWARHQARTSGAPGDSRNRLATTVRNRRRELDLSQEALAKKAGLNFKTVLTLEQALHKPHSRTLEALEIALELRPGTLATSPTPNASVARAFPSGGRYEITPTPDGGVRVRVTSPGGEPVELELPDAQHAIALARDLLNVATDM